MTEPDVGFKYRWRDAVLSEHGPPPTTRLVLLVLSTWMNADGSKCFPSTRKIALRSGLTHRSVLTHLEQAQDQGWIERHERAGSGRGWKRHRYVPTLPEAVKELHHPTADVVKEIHQEGPRRGESHARGGEGGSPETPIDTNYSLSGDGTDKGFPPASALPKANSRYEYPAEFEDTWELYPRRAGGNSKKAAYRAWRARVTNGTEPSAIRAGVERYAAWVRATGKEGTEFVKQARTFFGPDEHWEEPYPIEQPGDRASPYGGRL